jgi:gamma-glutamylcyclotransferase (GGCT)/AIG2-like uncharacterized protein YtfP
MSIPVFVYGSLRKDMGNHVYLQASTYSGVWITLQAYYMVGLKSGAFPCVSTEPIFKHTVPTKITGELYYVSYDTLQSLDKLEGVPNLYQRVSITIENGLETREAYVYMITDAASIEMWRRELTTIEPVVSGDWVKHTRHAS